MLDELGLHDDPLLKVAMELERIALQDEYFIEKKLYPNIDFYSGITLKALGFPTCMFTVLFALARTVGWIAQWKEMMEDPHQKIGRPRQIYTGAKQRDYVPLSQALIAAHEVDDGARRAKARRFAALAEHPRGLVEIGAFVERRARVGQKRGPPPAARASGGAACLQEFRHGLAAEQDVDQRDVAHVHQRRGQDIGQPADLVAHHHGRARQSASSVVTVPEAASATSAASNAANLSASPSTICKRRRPVLGRRAHPCGHMRHGRQDRDQARNARRRSPQPRRGTPAG